MIASLVKTLAGKDRFTLFFISGGCLAISVALFIMRINQPKIETAQDLKFFTGRLSEHHYSKSYRRYGISETGWFMLEGYSNAFDFDRDDLKRINRTAFSKLTDGDTVSIAIAKRDTIRLNEGITGIPVYSFRCRSVFLDYRAVIKSYNGYIMYGIGTVLFFISAVLFYFGCTTKNKTNPLSPLNIPEEDNRP